MKALVVTEPRSIALLELDRPVAREQEVLVTPVASGLCGTDLELIDGTIDATYVRYPLVLGHEWVGRISDQPDDALVVVEGIIPCGECAECQRGATNRCTTYDEIGFTRPGALAQFIAVPEFLVHTLAPGVDALDAVMIEPMAVVWRALTRATIPRGARCLVIGDGTVALLSAYLLKRFHPTSVTVLGRRESQAALVDLTGATAFLTERPDERFDVVIEAAGQKSSVEDALALVGRGGLVLLLGLPAHGTTVALAPDDLVNNDVTVQGSFSYTRSAWAEVVAMVNAGELRPSFLVTHRYPLEQWSRAVDALRHVPDDQPRGKVLLLIEPSATA